MLLGNFRGREGDLAIRSWPPTLDELGVAYEGQMGFTHPRYGDHCPDIPSFFSKLVDLG